MAKSLLLMLFFTSACLTLKYQAQKVWLFSKTTYMGNAPADRDGKALNAYSETLSCFLETGSNSENPEWQTAWYKGVKYAVNVLQVNQDSVIIGRAKNAGNIIAIKPGRGMKLIQLQLTAQGDFKTPKAASFVLEGVLNKKTVYLTSDKPPVELAPVLAQ
ncbi:MAG: hypothetical protein V4577_26980 [Bacteroidota bacterium]